MSRRAEELRLARSSYVVAWRNFIKAAAVDPDALFCFFEGEDLKYYAIRVDLLARPKKYCQFIVGGRVGVIGILQLVLSADSGRYAGLQVAFFVDGDFIPPPVAHRRLYVTPCYSIENLYVTRSALERLLESEFGLSKGDLAFEDALKLYETALDNFNFATRELNGWLRQQRLKEAQAETSGGSLSVLNLRDVRVWEFVELQVPQCTVKYSIASLDQRFGRKSESADIAAIQLWVNDKSTHPPVSVHRGKFLVDFLCKILSYLIEDANSRSPKHFPATRRVSLTIQRGNALSQLAQYADTPATLRDFLEQIAQDLRACGMAAES